MGSPASPWTAAWARSRRPRRTFTACCRRACGKRPSDHDIEGCRRGLLRFRPMVAAPSGRRLQYVAKGRSAMTWCRGFLLAPALLVAGGLATTGVSAESVVPASGTQGAVHILPATMETTQWGWYDNAQKPVLTVKPGDTVIMETMMHFHDQFMPGKTRSEEHTSELQSHSEIVCRLMLEKKKKTQRIGLCQTLKEIIQYTNNE